MIIFLNFTAVNMFLIGNMAGYTKEQTALETRNLDFDTAFLKIKTL